MKKRVWMFLVALAIGITVFGNYSPDVIINETVDNEDSRAVFASGCFWCTEAVFQETEGVNSVISGYAGGEEFKPSYEDVYMELTGHREAVAIYYDESVITYEQLLDINWRTIDPTDSGGQFIDRGMSYTTAIFYENEDQRQKAAASINELDQSGRFEQPIVTSLLPFTTFYEAEEYHQDFYIKSPTRYKSYESASGRAEFKALVWQEILKQQ